MRANPTASPDDIDITTLWGALRQSFKKLLLWSIVLGALTYAGLSLVAPKYESEAELAIVAKDTVNPYSDPKREGSGPEVLSARMDKEAVNTHVRALQSPDLAAKIVADLNLAGKVEFNSALGSPDMMSRLLRLAGVGSPRPGESEQDRVLAAYFKRLEVYPARESRVIGVRFISSDPALAAEVANRLSDTYREQLASQIVTETDEVLKALEPQIAKLSDEVSLAEEEVKRFRTEKGLFRGGQGATDLNDQQLQELQAEVSKAKAMRSEAESRTKSAHEMLKSGSADALPDVQKSPLIQNLVQQRVRVERQVSELSATLLPGHPRMRQLRADLEGLKRQISAEVAKIVEGLEKEAKVAALREESVTKSLDTLKARVGTTGPDEVKLKSLEEAAASKRSELKRLQAQFETNRNRADRKTVPVEAQVITRARAASVPSFPKKGPFAGLVAAATLLFGMALTLTKALLAGARGGLNSDMPPGGLAASAKRARETVDLPPVAVHAQPKAPVVPIIAAADPGFDDTITRIGTVGGLATHLISAVHGETGFRTLIAGDGPTFDPGSEAVELARTLAGKGRGVVLIDWSPEGGGLAKSLGLPSHPGFADLMDQSATFADVIRRIPLSEAHIIVQGSAVESVASLDIERLNLVLDALDEAYEHIIVSAKHEPARELFEALQGRFDAGVLVTDGKRRATVLDDPPGTYLGFEVADIDLVTLERTPAGTPAGQRITRGLGAVRPEPRAT